MNWHEPLTRDQVHSLIDKYGSERLDLAEMNLKEINLLPGTDWNPVDLHGINFEGSDLSYSYLQEANLTGANLKGAILESACVQKADLRGADLRGAKLKNAKLAGAKLHEFKISRETDLQFVDWGLQYKVGDEADERICKVICKKIEKIFEKVFKKTDKTDEKTCNQKDSRWENAADVYRELKVWYNEVGRDDIAGEFYYREWEARRKSRRESICNCSWKREGCRASICELLKRMRVSFWAEFFGLLCGHFERPWRVVSIVFVVVMIFAVSGVASSLKFPDSLYYSLDSFVTLGYVINKTDTMNWGRWLWVTEAFIGIVLISIFIATIVRKMTR